MNGPFELVNEDGTLAGFIWEPEEEERLAAQAWLASHGQNPCFSENVIRWNNFINGDQSKNERSAKDFSLHVRKSGENYPVSVNYCGHNLAG